MQNNLKFRTFVPTEEELRFAQIHFMPYTKAEKKEFARMQNLKPATPSDVERLQEEVGPLPVDYVNFLTTQNGGRPKPSVCKSLKGRKHIVAHLLALSYELKFYLSITNYLNVYQGRIPSKSLPIGDSPGGDVFLLDLRDEEFGAVLYWRHESESENDGSDYYGNVSKVASSFSGFLSQFVGEE